MDGALPACATAVTPIFECLVSSQWAIGEELEGVTLQEWVGLEEV